MSLTIANRNILVEDLGSGNSRESATNAPAVANLRTVPMVATFLAPIAAELITIVADVSLANGAQIIAAQPGYPVKLSIRVTDANSSITAGVVTVVGKNVAGEDIAERFALAGGTRTITTTKAYSSVTSVTVTSLAGAAGADHISVGQSAALALMPSRFPFDGSGGSFNVLKASVDGVNEAVGTVDTAAGTIIPTTAPNAAHHYQFIYAYTP